MEILQENWTSIKNKVILPLWNAKFRSMYESIKLDYNDFESLAGYELTKAIKNFNPEKSNLFTYASNVINKKAMTELRDCSQRDVRKALHTAESIDKSASEDSSKTVAKNIPHKDSKEEVSEITELRVGNFIKSLDNNQLRVLILAMLDFDSEDMSQALNISTKTALRIMRSLRNTDLTRVLYRRKF